MPVCKLPLRSFGLAFHQFSLSMTDWDLVKNFLLVPLGALLVDVFLPRCYLANSSKRTVLTCTSWVSSPPNYQLLVWEIDFGPSLVTKIVYAPYYIRSLTHESQFYH